MHNRNSARGVRSKAYDALQFAINREIDQFQDVRVYVTFLVSMRDVVLGTLVVNDSTVVASHGATIISLLRSRVFLREYMRLPAAYEIMHLG